MSHGEDEDDEAAIGGFYGIKPGIAGVLIGAAIIAFMFALADGFA
jgi:hypothetical protein